MVAITFFSGIQLFSLGVMGEYVARIYDESKNRPLYIIKEKVNFDNSEKRNLVYKEQNEMKWDA
jgi:dolichol-phosphate mannosyltransferase